MPDHELKHKPINALDSLKKGREFIFSALTSHHRVMLEVDAHVNCIKLELENSSSWREYALELKSLHTLIKSQETTRGFPTASEWKRIVETMKSINTEGFI